MLQPGEYFNFKIEQQPLTRINIAKEQPKNICDEALAVAIKKWESIATLFEFETQINTYHGNSKPKIDEFLFLVKAPLLK